METDLADEELAKQMSVKVQIIMHLATKWPCNQVRTDVLWSRNSETETNSEKVYWDFLFQIRS